jgi:microcystin-dependent protein
MYAGSSAPSGYLLCDGQSLDSVTNTEYAPLYGVIGTTYGGSGASAFSVPNLKGKIPVGLDSTQTEFDALGETGGAKTHTLTSAEVPLHTHTTNIGHGHANTLAAPAHTHNIGHGHASTLAAPAHTHSIDPPNTATTTDAHFHATNTAGDAGSFLSGTTNNYRYTDTSGSTLNTASDTHGHDVNIAAFTSGGASATALTGAVTDLPTTASGGASATALTGAVTDLATTDVTSSSSGSGGAHNNLQPYIVLNYIIKV